MTVYAITDIKKGRTWIAPTYLQTTLKLNKWQITIEKLYRKQTETEQILKKNYNPTVGLNRKPKAQQATAYSSSSTL